jgi:hypothetical protein
MRFTRTCRVTLVALCPWDWGGQLIITKAEAEHQELE